MTAAVSSAISCSARRAPQRSAPLFRHERRAARQRPGRQGGTVHACPSCAARPAAFAVARRLDRPGGSGRRAVLVGPEFAVARRPIGLAVAVGRRSRSARLSRSARRSRSPGTLAVHRHRTARCLRRDRAAQPGCHGHRPRRAGPGATDSPTPGAEIRCDDLGRWPLRTDQRDYGMVDLFDQHSMGKSIASTCSCVTGSRLVVALLSSRRGTYPVTTQAGR